MPLCTDITIVNANQFEGEAHALRCKRWSCPICHDFNRHRVMHLARKGEPNTFMTLTCDPKNYACPDEAARDMKRGLVLLRRMIERKWHIKNVPFIVVFEKTKKGWPHMHILLRAKYMHWSVLRGMWKKITGAYQVDIRFIKHRSQVLFYVTKYIGKELHAFEGCKRWWRSHNYQTLKDDETPKHLFGECYVKDMCSFNIVKYRAEQSGAKLLENGKFRIRWQWPATANGGWPWRVRTPEERRTGFALR